MEPSRLHSAILPAAVLLAAQPGPTPATAAEPYESDVAFALESLENECDGFFALKGVDWDAVSEQFAAEAMAVTSDQEHLVLLVRLLARLEDGHAAVRPLEKGKDVRWPDEPEKTGPGMFWCRVGDAIVVKNAWSSAAQAGVKPGMEVREVDGEPAAQWLDKRIAMLRDRIGFSSDHQAFAYACHWGLADTVGSEIELELKPVRGARDRVTVRFTRANPVPWGPAFFPERMEGGNDVRWSRLEGGYGYIHVRRCPGDLPEQIDAALAEVGDAPGIVLDFRGNSGGGFDHDAFMGRFVPAGETLAFAKRYRSAGPAPYGGPVVCIVDGTVRSAGETAAAIFKEDGRAYVIGESPTAGMSAVKKLIELPSGLFAIYAAVHSNMARSNDGKGLEGIGVIPHETVEFDPGDLAEERDTLISAAAERLENFPRKAVPYDPARFGWRPAKGGR